METKELIGQVIEKGKDFVKVKKDNKTIKINFRGKNEEIIKNVEVSESYKFIYLDNEKDGFTYHNGKSVEQVIIKDETKELPQEKIEIKQYNRMPYQVADTILMSVKDLIVAEINKGYEYSEEQITAKIKKLTKDFTEAYYSLA